MDGNRKTCRGAGDDLGHKSRTTHTVGASTERTEDMSETVFESLQLPKAKMSYAEWTDRLWSILPGVVLEEETRTIGGPSRAIVSYKGAKGVVDWRAHTPEAVAAELREKVG
jgi:hypothetical protein